MTRPPLCNAIGEPLLNLVPDPAIGLRAELDREGEGIGVDAAIDSGLGKSGHRSNIGDCKKVRCFRQCHIKVTHQNGVTRSNGGDSRKNGSTALTVKVSLISRRPASECWRVLAQAPPLARHTRALRLPRLVGPVRNASSVPTRQRLELRRCLYAS